MRAIGKLTLWSITLLLLFSSCQNDINQSEKVVLDETLGELSLENQDERSLAYLNSLLDEQGDRTAQNYYQRARIFLAQEQYQRSMEDIQKAIDKSPNEGKFYFVLGKLQYQKGLYKKAFEAIQKSEAFGYRHPDNFTIEGVGTYEEGNHELALTFLKQSDILHDNDSVTYLYLGLIYQEQNDTTQAMPMFRRAAQFKSLEAQAYGNMQLTYNSLRQPYKSLSLLENLDEQTRNNSEVICLQTAKALEMIGRRDSANVWYGKVLKLNPGQWDAQEKLGEYYYQRRDMEVAAEIYANAIKTNPEKALPYFKLGVIQEFYKANIDSAQSLFIKAAKRDTLDSSIQMAVRRIDKKVSRRNYFRDNPEALVRYRARQKAKQDSIQKAQQATQVVTEEE
ncbi:tetratricopeptide repeat protein [Sediminitomix flava]|uniref:Tfp pilus assembly protein PilF n=1 Tax=Sediminitomix flava TaxID=379075 RepID=A0A315Z624_SEDFL|nr:tetratricopeptide repeat protein [Sediminitomix flava]PWJ39104.1 Tfp pilus assembly protein PilF [Sediminitomix flava]